MAKARSASPARAFRQVPLELSVDFVEMLDAFCDAHHGASRARVIREAVAAFINAELANNKGVSERYYANLDRLNKERFTVVAPTPLTRPPSD